MPVSDGTRVEAAIAAAQERLRADPQDLGALVDLGTSHFRKGAEFFPDAVNELEDARRLGALDVRIFYCLGVMYQEMGLFPFALEEYQRYLRNYPQDKEVRLLAAKLFYRQGDFSAAIKEYERLRYHDPNDPLIIENLGLSLLGAKLSERAVECFQQLKGSGGLPGQRAEFYLGQIDFEAGRMQQALEAMLRSLPPEGAADFGIPMDRMFSSVAMAFQKLGRAEEAREYWQKVLKLSPSDAKARAALKDLNRRFPRKRQER